MCPVLNRCLLRLHRIELINRDHPIMIIVVLAALVKSIGNHITIMVIKYVYNYTNT